MFCTLGIWHKLFEAPNFGEWEWSNPLRKKNVMPGIVHMSDIKAMTVWSI